MELLVPRSENGTTSVDKKEFHIFCAHTREILFSRVGSAAEFGTGDGGGDGYIQTVGRITFVEIGNQ